MTPRKHFIQRENADAAGTVVATLRTRIVRYNPERIDAYRNSHGTEEPGVVPNGEADTIH